jgi:2-oxoglutarate/2-oxoacid ferredoxin oxidoreductase subunit alpha
MAEEFQVPVLILTDKYLAESEKDTTPFEAERVMIERGKLVAADQWGGGYKRYELTEDGVSPRALPGTKGVIVSSNSNEHQETGYSTDESNAVTAMVDKRFRKQPHIVEAVSKLESIRLYGDEAAEVTIIGWGGTKGPILEAIMSLEKQGIRARMLQIVFMEPFPAERVKEELEKTKLNFLFESNKTAQLGSLIRLHTGVTIGNVSLRYDGRPFNPDEISAKVLEAIKK